MLSNITPENRVKIIANRELGRSSQEHHNIETDHYPPIIYQLTSSLDSSREDVNEMYRKLDKD